MKFRSEEKEELTIGLTPLIDVVFILLIFFMVTTTFNRQSELKIDLPEASAKETEEKNEVLEIAIDASGKFYINQQPVTGTQAEILMQVIQDVLGDKRDLQVVIKADGQTPHQSVITAMDVAGRLGLNRLSLATSVSQQSAP